MKAKSVINKLILLCILINFLLLAPAAYAQYLVVSAEQVRERLTDGRKVMLIDTRTPDEYKDGHIPGALNIQPDRIKPAAAKLPKDKSTPIILYCRGAG